MGCHTWIYVHLPEKAKEMEDMFIKEMRNDAKYSYDTWLKSDAYETFTEFIRYPESHVEYYTTHSLDKIIAEHPETKVDILEENKILCRYQRNREYDKMKQYFIDKSKKHMDLVNSLNTIQDFKEHNLTYIKNYHMFNDKIYCYADGSFPFYIDSMHDPFRIYNYEAEPCFSLDDVLQRCKENNITLTDEQTVKLTSWFEKYPDTMIEFG